VLRQGGLILYPTDTIWGIGCDATNEQAVEKLYQLKKRCEQKSMIVLVTEERDILQYVAAPDMQLFDYLETCQKPTTVIYESAIGLATNLVNQDGTIAIRICKDDFCRHLIKRFQKPIVSTSANFSGDLAPATFKQINQAITDGVDYVVQWRQTETTENSPSALIKWNSGKIEVLRS
jgi:L-threonylcarbamoyladenylate synthase